jgi:hypothetical protein
VGHVIGAGYSTGARSVFYDDRLMQLLLKSLSKDARHDVDAAASTKWHH